METGQGLAKPRLVGDYIPPVRVQLGGQLTAGGKKYGKYSRNFPYLLIYLGSGRVTEKYEVTENVDLLD